MLAERGRVDKVDDVATHFADATIDAVVAGYSTAVYARHELTRHHLVCHFVVPVTWPLLMVQRAGDPGFSGEDDGAWRQLDPFAGYEVRSPVPARAQSLLANGLAQRLTDAPVRAFRIDRTGASILTRSGARLNRTTAGWLRDTIELVLRGAPPFDTQDLVVDPPGFGSPRSGALGTELRGVDAFLDEPYSPPTRRLLAALTSWLEQLSRVEAQQRSGSLDRAAAQAELDKLVATWRPELDQLAAGGADTDLVASIGDALQRTGAPA